jgi:hypothetical protein
MATKNSLLIPLAPTHFQPKVTSTCIKNKTFHPNPCYHCWQQEVKLSSSLLVCLQADDGILGVKQPCIHPTGGGGGKILLFTGVLAFVGCLKVAHGILCDSFTFFGKKS